MSDDIRSDELEDSTSEGEVFPITTFEDMKLKKEARIDGDEEHVELALKQLPCPGQPDSVRVAVAWVLTMKGFVEFHERILDLESDTKIHLMRDSKAIGSPIVIGKQTVDKESFAEALIKCFLQIYNQKTLLAGMLKGKIWYLEVPSVLVPTKKGRNQSPEKPLQWQPSSWLGVPGATSADKLKSDDLTAATIDLAHALANKKQRRVLEKDREARFEKAYSAAKRALLCDEARNSARARKEEGKARRRRVYKKVGDVVIKK
jgi:hypothetical protein